MSHEISNLRDRWLATKTLLAPSTQLAYAGELARFEEFCRGRKVSRVDQLSAAIWDAYVAELQAGRPGTRSKRVESLADSSAHQAQRIIRAFLKWLRDERELRWQLAEPFAVNAFREDRDASKEPYKASIEMRREIPQELVGGKSRDASEGNLRAAVATNLLFWAALRPAELCTLLVKGLSKTRGGLTQINLRSSEVPRFAPQHVWSSWVKYRRARERRNGESLLPDDPVLCGLQGRHAVTPWTIWSIVRSADREFARTPRDLRSEFLSRLTGDAATALKTARAVTGLSHLRPVMTGVTAPTDNELVEALSRIPS